jgi:hypothetical protein
MCENTKLGVKKAFMRLFFVFSQKPKKFSFWQNFVCAHRMSIYKRQFFCLILLKETYAALFQSEFPCIKFQTSWYVADTFAFGPYEWKIKP